MMIIRLFRQVKASKHAWPLIAGMIFRALFHLWNHHEIGEHSIGRWAVSDPDQWEYIDSVEAYLSGHGWNPDHRMPGYGVIYLLIRSCTNMATARDLLTLLQMVIGLLATYAFARSLAMAAQRPQWFWPFYGALLFASYSALSDIVLVNESFTTSALMLHWAAYVRYRSTDRLGWLVASGVLIGLATFLRPIYGPILAFVPMLEMLRRDGALVKRFKYVVVFALPFLIADGLWVVRNHRHYGGFHPLTNHGSWNPRYAKSTLYAVIEMVTTYGGHAYYWEPGSEVRWFGYEPDAGGGTPNAMIASSPSRMPCALPVTERYPTRKRIP
jgi:hypothetical protein